MLTDRFHIWIVTVVLLSVASLSFLTLGVSTTFGVSVAAAIVSAFFTGASNVAAYKLVFTYCNESTAGTIGWSETGGDLVAFALPLIFGAIANSESEAFRGNTLRLGMTLPASLLAVSLLLVLVLYLEKRPKK